MREREFSYRSLHGAPRARRRLLFATILIVVVVLLDIILGGRVRAEFRLAGSAIWRATSSMRASVTGSGYFASHRALAQENASLRAQIDGMRERAAGFDAIQEENAALRSLLDLASSSPGVTAPVISSFRSSPYGTFTIGAGQGDGIARGDIVLTPGGFVVGEISDVSAKTSLVSAIFASGRATDVIVHGTAAALTGLGGGNARATLPREITIAVGDSVLAPALGGKIVGVVGHIDSPAASAEQTLSINLPVNLSSLSYVYIVRRR